MSINLEEINNKYWMAIYSEISESPSALFSTYQSAFNCALHEWSFDIGVEKNNLLMANFPFLIDYQVSKGMPVFDYLYDRVVNKVEGDKKNIRRCVENLEERISHQEDPNPVDFYAKWDVDNIMESGEANLSTSLISGMKVGCFEFYRKFHGQMRLQCNTALRTIEYVIFGFAIEDPIKSEELMDLSATDYYGRHILYEWGNFCESKELKISMSYDSISSLVLYEDKDSIGSTLLIFETEERPTCYSRSALSICNEKREWLKTSDFTFESQISKSKRHYVIGHGDEIRNFLYYLIDSDARFKDLITSSPINLDVRDVEFPQSTLHVKLLQLHEINDTSDRCLNHWISTTDEEQIVGVLTNIIKSPCCEVNMTVSEFINGFCQCDRKQRFSFCKNQFLPNSNKHCTICDSCSPQDSCSCTLKHPLTFEENPNNDLILNFKTQHLSPRPLSWHKLTMTEKSSLFPKPTPKSACSFCTTPSTNLKICTRCKSAKYCTRTCQKKAWPSHKKTCIPKQHPNY